MLFGLRCSPRRLLALVLLSAYFLSFSEWEEQKLEAGGQTDPCSPGTSSKLCGLLLSPILPTRTTLVMWCRHLPATPQHTRSADHGDTSPFLVQVRFEDRAGTSPAPDGSFASRSEKHVGGSAC